MNRGWDTGQPDGPSEEALARVRAGRNPLYSTTRRPAPVDAVEIMDDLEREIEDAVVRARARLRAAAVGR